MMSDTFSREAIRHKRRAHSPQLKAKAALVAFQGDMTIAQLVKKLYVHANQITYWKSQLLKNISDLFGRGVLTQRITAHGTFEPEWEMSMMQEP